MKDIILDDILQVVVALMIIGICSMWILPPEYAEKVLIAVCSGMAGIAKGQGKI